MKQAHLLWVFPGFGVGGAQARFCALANWLGERCRHTVVSLNGDLVCREKLAPLLCVDFPTAGHQRGRMLASVLHARRFLAAARPDRVITSNWGAIEWAIGARLAGLALVHSEDGFGPEERTVQIPRRMVTRRLALRGADIILPSRTLMAIARDQWRLPERRLHYIPNGIDLARFTQAVPMELPAGDGPIIGTIAALRPEKNLGRLIRAFAALRADRPARLVIVGDGAERPGLEALADQLSVRADVLFAGHSTVPERWLAAFDLFALSSDTEQMPLSLLEAMAAGLPCVCTNVGDVRAMLPEGHIVTAAEDGAFAEGLRRGVGLPRVAPVGVGQEAMFEAWGKILLF
jgi:glycosyltransferase involved in cell wall biosynthesis